MREAVLFLLGLPVRGGGVELVLVEAARAVAVVFLTSPSVRRAGVADGVPLAPALQSCGAEAFAGVLGCVSLMAGWLARGQPLRLRRLAVK